MIMRMRAAYITASVACRQERRQYKSNSATGIRTERAIIMIKRTLNWATETSRRRRQQQNVSSQRGLYDQDETKLSNRNQQTQKTAGAIVKDMALWITLPEQARGGSSKTYQNKRGNTQRGRQLIYSLLADGKNLQTLTVAHMPGGKTDCHYPANKLEHGRFATEDTSLKCNCMRSNDDTSITLLRVGGRVTRKVPANDWKIVLSKAT